MAFLEASIPDLFFAFITSLAACSASGMTRLEPINFDLYLDPLLSASPELTHARYFYTRALVESQMMQFIVFPGEEYLLANLQQYVFWKLPFHRNKTNGS
jgi:hypothetical protein